MISGIQPIKQSSVVSRGISSIDSANSERFNTSPGLASIGMIVTPSSETNISEEELPLLHAASKQQIKKLPSNLFIRFSSYINTEQDLYNPIRYFNFSNQLINKEFDHEYYILNDLQIHKLRIH